MVKANLNFSKSKIVALIPARSGSKRVKDKNIRLLDGIPLLVWSILVCRHLGVACYVSTDSEKYAKIAQINFADVIMRPEKLAGDGIGDREVINHFIENVEDVSGQEIDLILYLRPTTPFRTTSGVRNAIQTIIDAGKNATGLRSVELMSESGYKNFEMNCGYLEPVWFWNGRESKDMTDWPNQKCPLTYKANGYVDIAKVETIKKGLLWGDKVIGFITPPTIEIDTERDLAYAEWIAKSRNVREEVIFR